METSLFFGMVIIILNIDSTKFICNVYRHNNNSLNLSMFKRLSLILLDLKKKGTQMLIYCSEETLMKTQ